MTAERVTNVRIIDADLSRVDHQHAIVAMLDAYMRDPMEGGIPMPKPAKRELVPGLRAHPACYVFLAYRDGTPVGFSICFLGFSTFNARPLINIHDIFVDSSVRGKGIGRMLLERIETRARELDCCRLTLEVRADNHVARGLYRKVGFDRAVVGPASIPMEFWRKPLSG
jgi:ribosomal protein S18 acetylase RimI-like enzyme